MHIPLTVLNPLLIMVTKGNFFDNQGRFYDLSFILTLWLCDVSKAVIKYNRLWRQWSQACSFLVLANKLFVVFSMGMPLAPQKKQNSSF